MKNNKDLFEKKIDLNTCQINGGRSIASSNTLTSSTGPGTGCDVRTRVFNDAGVCLSDVTC